MGTFSFLSVNDYPIFDAKNSYYSEIKDLIFNSEDFIEEIRPKAKLNRVYWGEDEDNVKQAGNFKFLGFRQTAAVCKQRLEIYGCSILKSKKDYNRARKTAVKDGAYDFLVHRDSFEQYLIGMKKVIADKLRNYDQFHNYLLDYLASGDFLIPYQSIQHGLYAILSVLEDDAIIEYDLSDVVVLGGYVDRKELHYSSAEKIIILAEGKTDIEFISASLRKLYPHLSYYYHFIDFEGYKVEGGASALVKIVKAFAASNVRHPIIALFDNDTAGIMEMNRLKLQHMPNSIKIIKYPDIKIARKYPTIGPTGAKKMNVNGLACGIEMYLGREIISNDDGLIPIRWLEYNLSENKYHGVLEGKNRIQKDFRSKLNKGDDWDMSEMDVLLTQIFSALR